MTALALVAKTEDVSRAFSGMAVDLRRRFDLAMRDDQSPLHVISTDGQAGFGATVAAFRVISQMPLLVTVSLSQNGAACRAVAANGCFAISLLGDISADRTFSLAHSLASTAFNVADPAWELPVHEQALSALSCEVVETHVTGVHRSFIARVVAARTDIDFRHAAGAMRAPHLRVV